MKNILVIYNIVFLFAGNILISNIHNHSHHDHEHNHDYEATECHECIIIESNNNYVINSQDLFSPNNDIHLFISEYCIVDEFDVKKTYLSRAPPIS